jgi:hypothetical protein
LHEKVESGCTRYRTCQFVCLLLNFWLNNKNNLHKIQEQIERENTLLQRNSTEIATTKSINVAGNVLIVTKPTICRIKQLYFSIVCRIVL